MPTHAAEPKLVVTTDPGSDPESVTEAPDGSLILGSAELLQTEIPADSASRVHLENILDAASRGAAVTRQLLALLKPEERSVALTLLRYP